MQEPNTTPLESIMPSSNGGVSTLDDGLNQVSQTIAPQNDDLHHDATSVPEESNVGYMSPEMTRQWSGIRSELGRLKAFDPGVYAEVVALLKRIDLLEVDNEDLRDELEGQHRFEGKE